MSRMKQSKNCRPVSISLSETSWDALKDCPNKSTVVNGLIEENIHRIGNVTIESSLGIRENEIKKIISQEFGKIITEDITPKIIKLNNDILKTYSLKYKVKK